MLYYIILTRINVHVTSYFLLQLREPVDGLENALLRTIAEQKMEQTRMTKIHSVTGALDWIGPKSELPHGRKANEGRTHSSRATCK